jgi:hypothetical protein
MNQNDTIAAVGNIFPASHFPVDYTLRVVGDVATFATWNNALGTQPSDDDLTASLAAIKLRSGKIVQSSAIESAYQVAALNTPLSYMGTTFWTDQNSQFMLLAASWGFEKAGGVPEGFAWWDSNGNAVPMTLAQLEGLALATLANVNAIFVKRKQLLAAIVAAATLAEVQAVVW